MKVISVFDTTVSDYNAGNEIIMESIYKHLRGVFPNDFFFKLPYMEITGHTVAHIRESDLVFFGGTNSLSSRMEVYKQWGMTLTKTIYVNDVILMGVGWWQYQERESLYTKLLLRRALSNNSVHSVRDSYAEKKLNGLGFSNVINTGCPTLWELTPEHCSNVKRHKSDAVIMTLTDYNKDRHSDAKLIDLLRRNYSKVYLWLQGVGDIAYLNAISDCNGLEIISPDLKAYDHALSTLEVDYVGTRLHAGIRALQHGRRTVIIAVDNRAQEMHSDFALPVVPRGDFDSLSALIRSGFETELKLPFHNIRAWKSQFDNLL